ncbi:MAG: UMP kinase [Patescibacteria group bacterium]
MSDNFQVLSLGGSLIVPKTGIDWKFLKEFRSLIKEKIKSGQKFIIIAGGGTTCRHYQQAANKVVKLQPVDVDWLGIHASRLNAHLLRTVFFDLAHFEVIKDPTHKIKTDAKIIIAGGWKPGWSTDYDAVMLAKTYGANEVINLSNIDYVYDKDPKKFSGATKIAKINWPDFKKIVGDKWIPGLSKPFDPIASKLAAELNLKVIIINGRKIANLKKCLAGEKFWGTIIE